MERNEWTVDGSVGEHADGTRMAINGKEARAAQSRLTVLRRAYIRLRSPSAHRDASAAVAGASVLYPVTLLRLSPLTGRRHQLRVHCAHSGHPILGDLTYDRVADNVPTTADTAEPPAPPDLPPPPPGRPLVHWASVCALRCYLHAEELHLPISEARGGEMHVRAPEPFSAELEDPPTPPR